MDRWVGPEILPSDILQRAPIRSLRERPAALKAIAFLVDAGWLIPLEAGTKVRGKCRKAAYQIVKG
ncbi:MULTISPECIES: hypothetical protein [Pacificibacter]|uniref:hypothetical protein n=1 Tax=Pacificibacter TaxID=1042323 RepID=UPI001C07F526|nr:MULTISPECIES: hypothetical protein [Pacificibacter]MBU2936369.1 hypothetical protein [Pacificibacter marinus]MDO6616593.1 hypothetical protein [Pacificibacter sp. 1_MG-2023]